MVKITKYAPVGITTLNRYVHFKRCIESLLVCTHADKTELYIALDYPLNSCQQEGYRKILQYVETIKGFKNVHIIKRDENWGALNNTLDLNKIIFASHDRIIKTDDDNEFSPNFLDYMNKGLEKYEKNDKVSYICGYSSIRQIPDSYTHNYYYLKHFDAWGFATWRKKYIYTVWDDSQLQDFISDEKNVSELKELLLNHYYTIREKIESEEVWYGDGVISLQNIMNDTYCVHPTKTLVRNHGFDGLGVHCKNSDDKDFYHKQAIDEENKFYFSTNDIPMETNGDILRAFIERPRLE